MDLDLISKAIKRFELVELIIQAGSTGTRFPYPDIPQLRDDTTQDIIVCGLKTWSVEALPLTANGNTNATYLQLANSFLTLYIEGEESIRQIPFIDFLHQRQAQATGTTFNNVETTALEYLKIDWNKTYLQAATPFGTAGAPNAQFSVLLGVSYKKLPPGAWEAMTKNRVQGW